MIESATRLRPNFDDHDVITGSFLTALAPRDKVSCCVSFQWMVTRRMGKETISLH